MDSWAGQGGQVIREEKARPRRTDSAGRKVEYDAKAFIHLTNKYLLSNY